MLGLLDCRKVATKCVSLTCYDRNESGKYAMRLLILKHLQTGFRVVTQLQREVSTHKAVSTRFLDISTARKRTGWLSAGCDCLRSRQIV